MLASTTAFLRLKSEQQKVLDFAVLVSHAIPNLKKTIHGVEAKIQNYSVADPDHFNSVYNERLKELSKHYRANLSKYLVISSFSFFESYFKSVMKELIDFQGGVEGYVNSIGDRHRSTFSSIASSAKVDKRKLQEPFKKKNIDRYKIHRDKLFSNSEFKMPSELFTSLGVRYLFELVDFDRFKSVMIPDLLERGFLMDLSDKVNESTLLKEKDLRETFDNMRMLRNRISHGEDPEIGFTKAMDFVRFLRFLGVKIDKHLVENYFVLENLNR